MLYAYHRVAEAQRLFEDRKARYPNRAGPAGFEAFIIRSVAEDVDHLSPAQARDLVESLTMQSYFWYAMGDEDRSAGSARLARVIYQRYQIGLGSDTRKERVGLSPMAQIQRQARQRVYETMTGEAGRKRLRDGPPIPADADSL